MWNARLEGKELACYGSRPVELERKRAVHFQLCGCMLNDVMLYPLHHLLDVAMTFTSNVQAGDIKFTGLHVHALQSTLHTTTQHYHSYHCMSGSESDCDRYRNLKYNFNLHIKATHAQCIIIFTAQVISINEYHD